MAESRFERWSRLKAEARQEEQVVAQPVDEDEASEEQRAEQALVENEELSEAEILTKYDLPDPDKIELGMDIKGFLNKEIPEALRRRALRSLWRSNPVLAVLDGLNDYDDDYTIKPGVGSVKTLYQVGKGMFDKAKQAEEALQRIAESEEIQAVEPSVSSSVRPPEPKETAMLEVESADEELEAVNQQTAADELVDEQQEPVALRYKPRMSFS